MILPSDLVFDERLRASYRRTAFTCPSACDLACELEGMPEADSGNDTNPFRVFARLPSRTDSLQGMDRGTMTTHRTSGPEAHAAKSALAQQRETTLSLYQEILRGLPVGIVVLQLESPNDLKAFRIIDVNPAAALLTGAALERSWRRSSSAM